MPAFFMGENSALAEASFSGSRVGDDVVVDILAGFDAGSLLELPTSGEGLSWKHYRSWQIPWQ